MNDLRAEVRFKNAILWRAIQDQFGPMANELKRQGRKSGSSPVFTMAAKQFGIALNTLSDFLNLRESPYSVRDGSPTPAALKIAAGLGYEMADLFPKSLYALRLPRLLVKEFESPVIVSLQEAQGLAGLLPSPEDSVIASERTRVIENALLTLSPQQEKVLRMRFGIGREALTLDQCGSELNLSRERIRQIEMRALWELRRAGPDQPHVLLDLKELAKEYY